MTCSGCANDVEPAEDGRCPICSEQLLDEDADVLVKISGGSRQAETCGVCGIKDGRDLPDSFRNCPMCKGCGDMVDSLIVSMRLRSVDIAIGAIKNTSKQILKAIGTK